MIVSELTRFISQGYPKKEGIQEKSGRIQPPLNKRLIIMICNAAILLLSPINVVTTAQPLQDADDLNVHYGYLGFFLKFKAEAPPEAKVMEKLKVRFTVTADYDLNIIFAKVSLHGAGISWSKYLNHINITEGTNMTIEAFVTPTEEGEIYLTFRARYDVWFQGWHSLYEEYGSISFIISHARKITYDDLLTKYEKVKASDSMLRWITGLLVAATVILAFTTIHYARRARDKL